MDATATRSPPGRTAWLAAAAVFAVAVVPFLPLLQAGFVNWDDDQNFLHNTAWRGLSWEHLQWMCTTFHYGGWHPLSWLSVAVDHAFWGMDPAGYHLTNILLHGIDSVLLYWLVRELFLAARSAAARTAIAAVVAALFAVHPLRVESVAWITERRGLLAAGFLLACVLCYLRAHRPEREPGSSRRLVVLSLTFYALSLMSKGMAMTLPVLLLVLDVHPLARLGPGPGRGRRLLRLLWAKVPFLAIAGAVGVLARLAQQAGGAVQGWDQYPLSGRLAQVAYSVWHYPWRTVVPVDLCVLHPLQQAPSWSEPRFWGSGLAVLAVTTAVVLARRRWPGALVAWLAYALLLLPVSGLAQAGPSLVAERYSYVPMMPLFALAGAGAVLLWRQLTAPWRGGLLAVTVLVGSFWAWSSHRQCDVWLDSIRLWTRTVAVHPDCVHAHLNLASALAAQDRRAEAVEHYRACTRLMPAYGTAWHSMGLHLLRLGQADEALAALQTARDLIAGGYWTSRPSSVELVYSLALASHTAGQPDSALAYCREAVAADPGYVHTYPLMTDLLIARGQRSEALRVLDQALAAQPGQAILLRLRARIGQ